MNDMYAPFMEQFAEVARTFVITDPNHEQVPQQEGLQACIGLFEQVRIDHGRVYLVGNGGSAAVASHALTDLVNTAAIPASVLHESSPLTCFTNDYGYEQAFARQLDMQAGNKDLLIAISSSGQSANILQSVKAMRRCGGSVVTFSGFLADNPLRRMGDINIWLDSLHYGHVEIAHQLILHYMTDRLKKG